MTSEETIKRLEAQVQGLISQAQTAEEERKKAIEDMMGTLERRLQDAERANQDNRDNHQDRSGTNRSSENRPIYLPGPNTRPPKFPSTSSKVANWEERMSLFLEAQGLGYTIRHSTNPVPIIGNVDRADLVYRHGEKAESDHEKAWSFLLDATADAPFEEHLLVEPHTPAKHVRPGLV